ncbi:hypothetical protein Btru_038310 [Bulinus truncatus]|nr:hypothetical protein Btru_038310 [Bulinus truncatus]
MLPFKYKIKLKNGLIMLIVAVISILFAFYNNVETGADMQLQPNTSFIQGNVYRKCQHGNFLLPGMKSCHPWLTCTEILSELEIKDNILGRGAQKIVKEGKWQGHFVAVNHLNMINYSEDTMYGLEMLKMLNGQPYVIQLVGWCIANESLAVVLTEKHTLGSADNVNHVLEIQRPNHNTLTVRFSLCYDFVKILSVLHSLPGGPYVMCDSNYPDKTLSQFLLTDNLTLILNDVDAMPQVRREEGVLIKCGTRELHGDFVAPEQLWPFDRLSFSDELMPMYDEKVDIWKIPDVCNILIGNVNGSAALRLQLFNIHSQCRDMDSSKRPTAHTILKNYDKIKKTLKLD